MPAFNPIQTGFQAGVLSPRMRGRVDTKVYRAGLARCENWIPTPQGSLLNRNGFQVIAAAPGGAADPLVRLLPFKSTSLGRYQIALSNEKMYVFTPAGALGAFAAELVTNSECNLNAGGWTFQNDAGYAGSPGDYYIKLGPSGNNNTARQTLSAVPAGTYRFQFRSRRNIGVGFKVRVGTSLGGDQLLSEQVIPVAIAAYSYTVTLAAPGDVFIEFKDDNATVTASAHVDDVSFRDATPDPFVAAPWKTEDIPLVQYAGETGRDRMVLVHPKYEPQVLTRGATGIWDLSSISTVGWSPPLDKETHTTPVFAGSEWPSVVDVWQGRLWLAATALKKNTFWASRPGGYDFTAANYNALTAGDGFSYDVAMRGEIRWMQGQKVMLVGCDDGEYSISANDGVVYAGNLGISQESAFGSAQIQAQPIGDEVLFVGPDRRKVRAMKFSLEGGGWYSRDLAFAAEHVTKTGIVDIAFARDPFSTIVLLLQNGTLACCNYDRIEEVNGWWTAQCSGAEVTSLSTQATPEGDEVWALAVASGVGVVVRLPMYDLDGARLDFSSSVKAKTPTVNGTMAVTAGALVCSQKMFLLRDGLTGYSGAGVPGVQVRVVGVEGTATYEIVSAVDDYHATATLVEGYSGDISATATWSFLSQVVAWGRFYDVAAGFGVVDVPLSAGTDAVVLDESTSERTVNPGTDGVFFLVPDTDGRMYTIGRPFTARAETLPLEGGNPAGTAQGFKVHYPDISARIVDSVPPLINGKRASEGRPFSTPLDTVEPRVSADVKVKNLGLSEGGIITIEQDLPFRTEVCAVYGQAQINKV